MYSEEGGWPGWQVWLVRVGLQEPGRVGLVAGGWYLVRVGLQETGRVGLIAGGWYGLVYKSLDVLSLVVEVTSLVLWTFQADLPHPWALGRCSLRIYDLARQFFTWVCNVHV